MIDHVYIGIATIEARKVALDEAYTSLKDAASALFVIGNDYQPSLDGGRFFVKHNDSDMGAAAKFQPFAEHRMLFSDGYFLTCDDDLIYPPDYVQRLIEGIERYDRKAVVSFHGKNLSGQASPWYHAEGERYPCLKTVEQDAPVSIIGTGCMGWHSSLLDVSMDIFTDKNAADLCFSRYCHEQGIPRIVLAHDEGWIRHSEHVKHEDTLYYRHKRDHQSRTDIYNSVEWVI